MDFLRIFLIRFAVSLALFVGAVTLVDPYGKRAFGFFPSVLQDDRPAKSACLRDWSRRTQVRGIILGTSRSLTFSPRLASQLTGRPYFNFAVSNSTVADMYSIYQEIRRDGVRPQQVVIGLDPDALLAHNWRDKLDQRIARREFLPSAYQFVQDTKALLTLTVLEDTVHSIEVAAGLKQLKSVNVFDFDGQFKARGDLTHEIGAQERAQITSGCAQIYHHRFEVFDTVSDLRFGQLEALLGAAAADQASVTIYITPINPATEAQMVQGTQYSQLKQQMLQRLAALAARQHVTVRDFSQVSSADAEPAKWSDCVHYGSDIANELARRILVGDGQ